MQSCITKNDCSNSSVVLVKKYRRVHAADHMRARDPEKQEAEKDPEGFMALVGLVGLVAFIRSGWRPREEGGRSRRGRLGQESFYAPPSPAIGVARRDSNWDNMNIQTLREHVTGTSTTGSEDETSSSSTVQISSMRSDRTCKHMRLGQFEPVGFKREDEPEHVQAFLQEVENELPEFADTSKWLEDDINVIEWKQPRAVVSGALRRGRKSIKAEEHKLNEKGELVTIRHKISGTEVMTGPAASVPLGMLLTVVRCFA